MSRADPPARPSRPLLPPTFSLRRFPYGSPLLIALILCLAPVGPMAAQDIPVVALPLLAGPQEDALRLNQLLGRATTEGFLLRTPSMLIRPQERQNTGWGWDLLAPDVHVAWNSALPFSFNDGALWAGRGLNARVVAGARVAFRNVSLILAPEILYSANGGFQTIVYPPTAQPSRSPWATPFHPLPESLDLPMRFGDDRIRRLEAGQSSLTVETRGVAFGIASENAWWGPSIRNGLVLSNHAGGVPHLFARTRAPIQTPLGAFQGRWMLGWLRESDFFDDDPSNDRRTLSGVGILFQPAFDEGLTLGVARMVYAPLEGGSGLSSAVDFLRNVGRPNQEPWPETRDAWGIDGPLNEPEPGPDQVTSWFFRWVVPSAGVEVYGEWARFEQPASLRDFMEFPEHTRGHTLGFQWVEPWRPTASVRIQAELTNLEPSSTWRHRNVASTYASRVVPQGYTHRGQVLGAAIGPGASSQWLAGDWLDSGWRVGAVVGRIRWDAAAQFTDAVAVPKREDVSVFWGLRGGVDLWGWEMGIDLTTGVRVNYLFQTFTPDPITGRAEGVDVANTTLSVNLSRSITR